MPSFERDRFTWLSYLLLAYYAALQASIGPIIPFLRNELDLSYTTAGLHASAFAAGMMLAGATAGRLKEMAGRQAQFWIGGTGMALGALLLILGGSRALTIGGAFLMGSVGTWLLIAINAALTDRHGGLARIALTESNVIASIGALLIPILIASLESTAIGWRGALGAAIALWAALAVMLRFVHLPVERERSGSADAPVGKLPQVFGMYLLLLLFIVSAEWSVIYWGADFLATVVHLPTAQASGAFGLYFAANIASRVGFSRLSRVFPGQHLLLAALLISLIGFPIFWLAASPQINLVGLFLAGLGIGSLYPLTLSLAMTAGIDQANRASARISLVVGLAMLVTPQALASVADLIGLFHAYAVVLALLIGGMTVFLFTRALAGRMI